MEYENNLKAVFGGAIVQLLAIHPSVTSADISATMGSDGSLKYSGAIFFDKGCVVSDVSGLATLEEVVENIRHRFTTTQTEGE